jgi:hypothetical protein
MLRMTTHSLLKHLSTLFVLGAGFTSVALSQDLSHVEFTTAGPTMVAPAASISFTISVINTGGTTWSPFSSVNCPGQYAASQYGPSCNPGSYSGQYGIRISSVPMTPNPDFCDCNWWFGDIPLAQSVAPGQTIQIAASVNAPTVAGNYTLVAYTLRHLQFAFGPNGTYGDPSTSFNDSPKFAFQVVSALPIHAPINAEGSSVFRANRGTVPVKFAVPLNGNSTCQLPPATITVTRTAGNVIGSVNESDYTQASDSGSNFRIDTAACQYIYNLGTSSLGAGTYQVQIFIGNVALGTASFGLK